MIKNKPGLVDGGEFPLVGYCEYPHMIYFKNWFPDLFYITTRITPKFYLFF